MFHPAGILQRGLAANADADEPVGEDGVAFQYVFGAFPSTFGERDIAVAGHGDISFFAQVFIATLTLGLLKFISVAISMERTCPSLFCNKRMVSR